MLRRVAAGLGMSAAIFGFSLVAQIFGVPILIGQWGAQVYGEWVTLTNVVATLALFNLGVQSYMLNLLIAHYKRDEIEAGTRVLQSSLRLYGLICGTAFLFTVGLALWPSLAQLLKIEVIDNLHLRIILIIQGAWVTYSLLAGVLMSVLIAINQYPRRLRYSLADRLILLGLPLVVALFGGSPIQAVLVMVVFMLILAVVQIRDVHQRTPFEIGLRQSSWGESRALIRPSIMFLAVRLSNVLLTSGMVVIVSAAGGGIYVALYATTIMMTNFIRSFTAQGLNVMWPEITGLAAEEDYARLQQWHRTLVKLLFGMALILGAGLVVFGPDVLRIWTRGELDVDVILNLLLVWYLVVQASTLVTRTFGLATNHQSDLFRIELATAIVTLGAAVILVPLLGARGAALALVSVQVLNTWLISRVSMQWTQDSLAAFVGDWLGRGWLVIVLLLAGPVLIWLGTPNVLLRGALLAGLLGIAGVGGWRWWLADAERALVTGLARRSYSFVKRAG